MAYFFPNQDLIFKYGLLLHYINTYLFIIRLVLQFLTQNTLYVLK